MKYCIHVTTVASIEVEASSVAEAKQIALGSVETVTFLSTAEVFEKYTHS